MGWRRLVPARWRGRHIARRGEPAVQIPGARESVELIFRDGSRVRLPDYEAAAFRQLAGDLAAGHTGTKRPEAS